MCSKYAHAAGLLTLVIVSLIFFILKMLNRPQNLKELYSETITHHPDLTITKVLSHLLELYFFSSLIFLLTYFKANPRPYVILFLHTSVDICATMDIFLRGQIIPR